MKESLRMAKLFDDLYQGSPWIDVTILPHLTKLTAKQAAKRLYAEWNTIWEITNHMIQWRETVLKRVQGRMIASPANNYIRPVRDTSEAAWKKTLERFEKSQTAWIHFLKSAKASDFHKKYGSSGLTYYELIQGILQHDAYHLGQIVIMRKKIRS